MSREIDALIAFHLFGWRFFGYGREFVLRKPSRAYCNPVDGWIPLEQRKAADQATWRVPVFCGPDWNAMAQVIEAMAKRGFRVEINSPDRQGCSWVALFCRQGENSQDCPSGWHESHADTLPMAVALAALQASGVEIGGGAK